MIKTSDFPYPVLRNDKQVCTGYKREYYFILNVDDPEIADNEYIFLANVESNSKILLSLLIENIVDIYFTYNTNIIRKTNKLISDDLKFEIRIPIADLQSFDEIKISSIITANQDIELPYNEEFDEGYNLGFNYYITKKDVLAISNDVIFSFNKTGKTIIKIQKCLDLVNGFKIDISQDDFIIIQVNSNFKQAYDNITMKQSNTNIPILTTINASLIYLTMVNVIVRLSNEGNTNHHINKRWYKVMKATLSNKNINLEETIQDLVEEPDINKVYECVNSLLNDFYEKSIIKCSEGLK